MIRALCVAVALSTSLVYTTTSKAEEQTVVVKPQYSYQYSDYLADRVTAATAQAIAEDKLLLLVLGAQWCHDSRSFSQQLSTEKLHAIVEQHYVPVFVDVGYYRDVRWLTKQYDYPSYFATPSVMIIDPESNTLLNMESMAMWNSAHDVSNETYLNYFSQPEAFESASPINQGPAFDAIREFSQTQSDRLFAGFALVGPLLKLAKEDKLDNFDELEAVSLEVYDFRMQLQQDIHQLYLSAQNGSSADELIFPSYGPFSWE
ncbi:thioredoxin family protein [Alteromonas facilis]|uniref:thioredoxin family protein n=1 Tax=Alteromonas facilis TaxID=2048004 RepID=UPI000C285216|nr:thioredoxin family protein [Alteromonas facilis]